jgi:hypothetical protein
MRQGSWWSRNAILCLHGFAIQASMHGIFKAFDHAADQQVLCFSYTEFWIHSRVRLHNLGYKNGEQNTGKKEKKNQAMRRRDQPVWAEPWWSEGALPVVLSNFHSRFLARVASKQLMARWRKTKTGQEGSGRLRSWKAYRSRSQRRVHGFRGGIDWSRNPASAAGLRRRWKSWMQNVYTPATIMHMHENMSSDDML